MDEAGPQLTVRPAMPDDADYVRATLIASWSSTTIARRNELIDAAACPALIAEADGAPVGLLTYLVDERGLEVVSIDAQLSRSGVGSALLASAAEVARHVGVPRLWLVTTNDNVAALRFYQRRGLDLVAVHRDAVHAARALKPSIPVTGAHGIPIRHEIELELPLTYAHPS